MKVSDETLERARIAYDYEFLHSERCGRSTDDLIADSLRAALATIPDPGGHCEELAEAAILRRLASGEDAVLPSARHGYVWMLVPEDSGGTDDWNDYEDVIAAPAAPASSERAQLNDGGLPPNPTLSPGAEPSAEKIERAARALAELDGCGEPFPCEHCDDSNYAGCRALARAVLIAAEEG